MIAFLNRFDGLVQRFFSTLQVTQGRRVERILGHQLLPTFKARTLDVAAFDRGVDGATGLTCMCAIAKLASLREGSKIGK